MPKMKTHRGAAKRVKLTGSGKLKRSKSMKRHILTKKSAKTKRKLGKAGLVSDGDMKRVRKILPYI